MASRVAVVTGANKGIGYGIVRGLCKLFTGDVYLTARDESKGMAALEQLKTEGVGPKFHVLDINDLSSINKLKDYLQEKHGGLDVLVNNAGMAYGRDSTAPFSEQAEVTIRTNYSATLDVCNALFPILRPHARVVHISSGQGKLTLKQCSEDVREKLLKTTSTTSLSKLMHQFIELAKEGKLTGSGWFESAYGVSKMGQTQMAIIQQLQMNNDSRQDIIINACCPGYVKTDMAKGGTLTIEEGVDTPLYLALLPENCDGPKGRFVRQRQAKNWR